MASKKVSVLSPRRRPLLLRDWDGAPPPLVRKPGPSPKSLRHQRVYSSRTPQRARSLTPLLLILAFAAAVLGVLRFLPKGVPQLKQEMAEVLSTSAPLPLPPQAPDLDAYHVRHTVRRGETLSTILEGYGFGGDDARAMMEAMRQAGKDGKPGMVLRAGQSIELVLSLDGRLLSMQSTIAPGSDMHVWRGETGSFEAALKIQPKVPRERIAVGRIESSFAAAAHASGIQYDVVDDLVDLFSGRVSFHRDFHKGDRFTLIYQDRVLPDGSSLQPGPILAAALEINREQLVAVRYVGTDGKARYFDGLGKLIGDTFLRYPLKFSRISSHFTNARFHPVLKRRRPHNGVDFAAPIGTPVRSVADGRVLFAGRSGGSGIMVKIQHNDRYSTAYLHLSKLGKGIRKGVHVRRGDMIGAVGMTGLATGPHLHFSFYDRGKYVDPLKIKLPTHETLGSGTAISPKYLKRALYTLHHYQKVELGNFYWDRSDT